MNYSKTQRTIILVVVSMVAGLMYLTPFLRFSFYDQMKEALQLTDIQIGNLGSIYGTVYVISFLPSGFLSERFSTKKLLMISCLGMAAATAWYSFYPGYKALLVIHALYGFFSVGTFWSPYLIAVRNLGSEEEQSKLYGSSEALRGVAQTIVSFICIGAMSLIASLTVGFKVLLYINTAALLVLTVALMILMPDDKKTGAAERKPEGGSQDNAVIGAFRMLKDSSVWICIFVVLCGYTLWSTVNGYIGTYCTRVLNIPANISSAISVVRSYIIVFVAGFSGGVVMDRFKSRGQGLMIVYLLCGVSAVGILLTDQAVFVCLAVTIILSYMVNVVKSTYWSILGDAGIPLAATGMATAIISLIGLTGDIFVPPVISRFITYGESIGNLRFGFNLMLFWIAVWAVLGVLASLILKKRKEKLAGKTVS